jgi:hypothetical protein
MKLLNTFMLLGILTMISSCTMERRHYRNGWFIDMRTSEKGMIANVDTKRLNESKLNTSIDILKTNDTIHENKYSKNTTLANQSVQSGNFKIADSIRESVLGNYPTIHKHTIHRVIKDDCQVKSSTVRFALTILFFVISVFLITIGIWSVVPLAVLLFFLAAGINIVNLIVLYMYIGSIHYDKNPFAYVWQRFLYGASFFLLAVLIIPSLILWGIFTLL